MRGRNRLLSFYPFSLLSGSIAGGCKRQRVYEQALLNALLWKWRTVCLENGKRTGKRKGTSSIQGWRRDGKIVMSASFAGQCVLCRKRTGKEKGGEFHHN